MLWTTEIPEGSVEVDLDEGEAILRLENLCTVFDAFSVPNSFDPTHALGFVGATLRSLHIRWTGIGNRISFSNPTTRFAGNYVENSATIAVTVETPATKPPFTPAAKHGFQFVADPVTTVTHFAQIGHEQNGSLF